MKRSELGAQAGQVENGRGLSAQSRSRTPELQRLIEVVREISRQSDYPRLFRLVVEEVVSILGAEGGTLYLHDKRENSLQAVIVLNRKLELYHAIKSYQPGKVKGLFSIDLSGRNSSAAGYCWKRRHIVSIADTAQQTDFDLSGMHTFDRQYSYRTSSLVAVPLISRDGEALGVVQAINVTSERTSDPSLLGMAESVSAIMGMALENKLLLQDSENLLRSVVAMVADAIDEKSKTTSGHCARVTELTLMMVRSLSDCDSGEFRDFSVSKAELDEIRIAAQLHDIGKIAIPDIVLEKRRKLDAVTDRFELVRTRFAARRAELRAERLEAALQSAGLPVPDEPGAECDQDEDDLKFVERLNRGGERLAQGSLRRLEEIACRPALGGRLISDEELMNLTVQRGTLNAEEVKVMRKHALITVRLLERLPWPAALANVPEIAGKHHENIDGGGYPAGLKGDAMSLPAKILCIADRFEGLSAIDRNYRKRKKLSEVLRILDSMCTSGQIDESLYRFFIDSGLHMKYARKYLPAELLDIN